MMLIEWEIVTERAIVPGHGGRPDKLPLYSQLAPRRLRKHLRHFRVARHAATNFAADEPAALLDTKASAAPHA